MKSKGVFLLGGGLRSFHLGSAGDGLARGPFLSGTSHCLRLRDGHTQQPGRPGCVAPAGRRRKRSSWVAAASPARISLGGGETERGASQPTKANVSFLVFKIVFCSKRKGVKSRHCGEGNNF